MLKDSAEILNAHQLPQAVIFDMDGVLADTEPLHGECFMKSFAHQGINISFEDYRLAIPIGGSTVRDYFVSLGGDPSAWDEVKVMKDELMQAAVAERAVPMPGVLELLHALKEAGIRTAVATSARRASLSFILDKLQIWDYFNAFATKENTGEEKPDPSLFLFAARELGVHPAQCVTVEDSPRGTVASYRAGMKCIAVPTITTADGDFSLANIIVPSLEVVTLDTLSRLMSEDLHAEQAKT